MKSLLKAMCLQFVFLLRVPPCVRISSLWLCASALLLSPVCGRAQSWHLVSQFPASESLACSANGEKVFACSTNGQIFYSYDSGTNWMLADAPATNWGAISCSADGKVLAALANVSDPVRGDLVLVFVSTNNGSSWFASGLHESVQSGVEITPDGNALLDLSTAYGVPFYMSKDMGITWNELSTPGNYMLRLRMSRNGSRIAAMNVYGELFESFDAGSSWRTVGGCGVRPWYFVSSSEGNVLAVSDSGDPFDNTARISTNYGNTWFIPSLPDPPWQWNLICSADGKRFYAIGINIKVNAPAPTLLQFALYRSTDMGMAWEPIEPPSTTNSFVLAISADGTRCYAASANAIYVRQEQPMPILRISQDQGSISLSWIVPSRPFVLQTNASLAADRWQDDVATPQLNFTNLNYTVTKPSPSTTIFYRLQGTGGG